MRTRLDEIAAQTNVRIAVVNSPQSLSLAPPDSIASDGGWTGLETERVCELAIAGDGVDCVDVARVRLLVMLDELVSQFYMAGLYVLLMILIERLTFRGLRGRP